MRQMTLRDIPDDIEMIARNEAIRQGVSLNKAFLMLLRKSTQQKNTHLPSADKKQSSRFSRFCGLWTDNEASEFDKDLLEQRKIDTEAWQ